MTNRYFLGFDLRACAKDYVAKEWRPERRSRYLLKRDVEWPLSVDTAVWPSRFHFASRYEEYRPVEMVEIEPVSTEQLVLRLWDDVVVMEAAFRDKAAKHPCFVRSAIELLDDRPLTNPEFELVAEGLRRHGEAPEGWTALGYDVADADFVSALMNCGYDQEERRELSRFTGVLNEFGLFDDLECAMEFRSISERRVPEHAPFFSYRLSVDLNGRR